MNYPIIWGYKMRNALFVLILLSLTSCESRSIDGHVYIYKPAGLVHDPDCGKCKEIETGER